MQIERQARGGGLNFAYLACGCLSVLVGGGLMLAVAAFFFLPGFILQLSGFESRGSTDALFESVTQPPTVVVENATNYQGRAVIELGRFGAETLNNNLYSYTLVTGNAVNGGQVATVTFDEPGLQALCRQRSDICGPTNNQFRNARIDLKPGGAVVYGEVFVPQIGIWQNAGIVLQLAGSSRLVVAGVDVGGTLYSVPPNELRNIVAEVERISNEALQQMALEAGGTRYNLSEVYIDEQRVTLVLR